MIVEATLPLVLEHGEGVTTRQIAQRAGIAEGTIFRAFADKDELLDAVLEAGLDPAPLELALGEVDASLPLDEVVTRAVALAQHRFAEIWRLLSAVGLRGRDRGRTSMIESPALGGLLAAPKQELSVTPRVAARTLRALIFAMSHPMVVDRPASPAEVARLYLHGVVR